MGIRLGLRAQIGLVLMVIMVVTVALVGVAAVNLMRRAAYDQLAIAGERVTTMIAEALTTSMDDRLPLTHPTNIQSLERTGRWFVDWGVTERLEIQGQDGSLVTLVVQEESSRELPVELQQPTAWRSPSNAPIRWEELSGSWAILLVSAPMEVNGQPVGSVLSAFAHRGLASRLQTVQLLTVAYVILDALLLLIAGYVLLTRIIVTPIRRIALATERVAAGDYASHLDIGSHNEIGALAQSFNHMVDRLNQSRRDLEERVIALKEAKQALEKAQSAIIRGEKLASVGRLAAGIAHEVGNPLSALLGFVEILREDPKLHLEYRKEILARLEQELLRIHEIIRGLLDYSRSKEDEPAETDVPAVIHKAQQLVKTQPRFRDIEIRTALQPDLPGIRVNPDRFLQVLINLLLNAADAIEGQGWVGLTAERADGGVSVRVQDSGPGISPGLIGQIFEPFFTTKPPGQGTGLGLAICERIVESCQGRIEVVAKTDHGACFTVWFPEMG